jgi:hypothetical protein
MERLEIEIDERFDPRHNAQLSGKRSALMGSIREDLVPEHEWRSELRADRVIKVRHA